MADKQQQAAKEFLEFWRDKGYEKGQSQPFWLSLLRDVYGVDHPERYITFEDQVHLDHTSFIDGYIPATRVMIEQKGLGKNLNLPIKQSDGSQLTPFQQAKRYIVELPVSKHPRYVITCNFEEFWVYDMDKPEGEPEKIKLKNLDKEYYRLDFLVKSNSDHLKQELEVSVKAGEIVGLLYNAFIKQYDDPNSEETMRNLNVLCVRLVFCLYAENAGIFGSYGMFHDYLKSVETHQMRKALVDLFHILDTKEEDRDKYLEKDNPRLAAFPYVNGGLFSDENIDIPPLTEEIRTLLLEKASEGFNWSYISPTIFGAVFESTLNPETRRSGGMHYTSVENIHKVIDPLFMDDLNAEFSEICEIGAERTKKGKLDKFQHKLSSLTFLDPACGSGNFLTESYLSLRRLENEVLKEKTHGQITFGFEEFTPIEVSIGQFYGIEINDFAVSVAKTALWIAESQMMKETEQIVQMHLDYLPLKSFTNIVEGNALRLNWEDVVPKEKLSYIMGNPPFIGYSLQSREQKEDILSIYVDEKGKRYKTAGKIDYVAAWYFKAAELMNGTFVRTAFVSTNSITQGEQVASVWKPLYERFGIHIDFAYRSFPWNSEASQKAQVHCVIIGFSVASNLKIKQIFDSDRVQRANNINAYLMDAPNLFIASRNESICKVPAMIYGSKPTDGGFLFLTPEDYNLIVATEPNIDKYIKQVYGATEYIYNKKRYCLWLVDANPEVLHQSKFLKERIEGVRSFRMASSKEATRRSADYPSLFQEIRQPNTDYIIFPEVSSANRKYIPISFASPEIICTNLVKIIPNATLYHFGILTSNIHMAWMRATCGRFGVGYRYSINIVYNNFPWPNPINEQKAKIESTAQAILDARALYPDASLADLYDETTMPPELRKAHQENDRAVMNAYGFDVKTTTESSCVAELMKMYQKLVKGEN